MNVSQSSSAVREHLYSAIQLQCTLDVACS
uniref:Uncharacterized protein n=1 Tax=Anguilla anguilla TaxID=7936 RepID=A0A0E9UVK7_ANGAN